MFAWVNTFTYLCYAIGSQSKIVHTMKSTTTTSNPETWYKNTIDRVKKMDGEMSFYTRITGQLCGTCPTTVCYVGKSTMFGKTTYFFATDLKHIFQSFQWHCVFANDINKSLPKASRERIFTGDKKQVFAMLRKELKKHAKI